MPSTTQTQQPAERCLLCKGPAPPSAGGSMLCELRGQRLHLLGHLCAACHERLERAKEHEKAMEGAGEQDQS